MAFGFGANKKNQQATETPVAPVAEENSSPENEESDDSGDGGAALANPFLRRKKTSSNKRQIGEILHDAGVLTNDQIFTIIMNQKECRAKGLPVKRIGVQVVERGYATEGEVADALAEQLNYERVKLTGFRLDDRTRKAVRPIADISIYKKYQVMPYEANGNMLKLAMADPLDNQAIDEVSVATGCMVTPVVSTPTEIMAAADINFSKLASTALQEEYTESRRQKLGEQKQEEETTSVEDDSPIVKIVRTMIEEAARMGCSDIHLEPMEDQVRLRYRIDGSCVIHNSYDVALLPAIIARIKIISGLDISEKRIPQDGRITQMVDKVEYDIRVSILPTVYGEKVVMRLTIKKNLSRSIETLGFTPKERMTFEKILDNPNGIILVTGPTGSGKSTTLYTALSKLNTSEVNIITVEDPVEANIPGINQVQTNEKAGLTFEAALRSILRQDPDIIMIGEIRDVVTANIAVTASITGHLVVSTLHTNSAASTITRLADMGIERYLIADATVGVIAQRLVKRLCSNCKEEYEATEMDKRLLFYDARRDNVTIPDAIFRRDPNNPTPNELKLEAERNALIADHEEKMATIRAKISMSYKIFRKHITYRERIVEQEDPANPGQIIKKTVYEVDKIGCPLCNYTGYKGRTGVYEIMPLTGKIKEVVADKTKTAEDIERQALAENMATLRVSTRNKVLAGITSMEEFKRIAYSNEDSDDATAAAAE